MVRFGIETSQKTSTLNSILLTMSLKEAFESDSDSEFTELVADILDELPNETNIRS